jgi:hypothetical protein
MTIQKKSNYKHFSSQATCLERLFPICNTQRPHKIRIHSILSYHTLQVPHTSLHKPQLPKYLHRRFILRVADTSESRAAFGISVISTIALRQITSLQDQFAHIVAITYCKTLSAASVAYPFPRCSGNTANPRSGTFGPFGKRASCTATMPINLRPFASAGKLFPRMDTPSGVSEIR